MNSTKLFQQAIGFALVALLLVGCGGAQAGPTTTPVPPTATPTPTPPQVILGYIEDIPAAFVQPEVGLIIEIPVVTYAETGALERYEETVRRASGEVLELEFYDLAFTATGLVEGYTASIDGVAMKGPSKGEFESASEVEGKIAFAPDRFLPAISLTCTGEVESTVEYAYTDEGAQQVASHELICPDQKRTYDLKYSEYTYDEIGRLSGFSVRVEMSPMD